MRAFVGAWTWHVGLASPGEKDVEGKSYVLTATILDVTYRRGRVESWLYVGEFGDLASSDQFDEFLVFERWAYQDENPSNPWHEDRTQSQVTDEVLVPA